MSTDATNHIISTYVLQKYKETRQQFLFMLHVNKLRVVRHCYHFYLLVHSTVKDFRWPSIPKFADKLRDFSLIIKMIWVPDRFLAFS